MTGFKIEMINRRVEKIEALLKKLLEQTQNHDLLQKEVLDFKEACTYLRISDSTLYKLKFKGVIPHIKPNGGRLYFKRSDLDSWLLNGQNTMFTEEELEELASKKVQELTNDDRLES